MATAADREKQQVMEAAAAASAAGRPTLNPLLKDFWLTPARIRVLYGGRSSSKSWDAAGMAVYLAANYRVKFLCTRQYQNRIEESVYSLLKFQIERFGLRNEFRILNNKIIHLGTGSEFLFYGLWRNIDEIKSLEGVDVCWIEEAHNLLEDQWRVLRDTIRKEGSQFWVVFNPQLQTDFVYRRFVLDPPPRTITRLVNYYDNPFLPDTIRQTIEEIREEDEEEYRHVYLGEPLTDDEQVIIKRRWVEAAIDAATVLDVEPTGRRFGGFDVADEGDDANALILRHGPHVHHVEQWQGGEDQLMESCTHVWKTAQVQRARVRYDSIGVGAHCGSKFKELNAGVDPKYHVAYEKFNAGGEVQFKDKEYMPGVKHGDHFLNAKAQAWWMLADRFRATYRAVREGATVDPEQIVSIDPECEHLERLVMELSTPRRDYNANGKIMVEKKADMKKRGIDSPNLADAFVSAFAPSGKRSAPLGEWL